MVRETHITLFFTGFILYSVSVLHIGPLCRFNELLQKKVEHFQHSLAVAQSG